jgi:signal peptidase II
MTARRWWVPATVIVAALAADQGSKAWARGALVEGAPVPWIDGFWDWELAYNPGAAFSVLGDGSARVVLTLVGIAAVVAIGWLLVRSRPDQRVLRWGLALVGAGAAGNLIDRIASGAVTDFVRWRWHEHRWPVFNVADAALLIGGALLVLDSVRRRGATLAPGDR